MKVLTVVGARPQLIKAAPICRVVSQLNDVQEVLVHTGQHFDAEMSDVFFDELDIPAPAYHLGISGGNHGEMTGRMLQALEPVVAAEYPDVLLTYGDTNSTLAGALVAAKLNVPVAHVEAGLRSFNRRMPEEVNRLVVDHLSAILLCPTRTAVENLSAEGIKHGVHLVGDVMFDEALHAAARAGQCSAVVERLGLDGAPYSVATVHRAENTDHPESLSAVLDWLRQRARDMTVVLPLHPRTAAAAANFGVPLDGLVVCPPLGYFDMTRLVMGAEAVFTDSGGLQKEAYFHRVPCVTLRDETEWTETVEAGWNRLWKDSDYLPRTLIGEYGDGHAAEAILDAIVAELV